MWYRTGTVTVTNGSAVVTGAGTDFVANVSPGEAMIGPDFRIYEVAAVISATSLTVVGLYQGATAGGQPYMVLPTQSFARDLALGAAELLNTFSAVRDGIGQGLIADGVQATPGIRFAADQDTGIARVNSNAAGLISGGLIALTWNTTGIGIGTTNPLVNLDVSGASGTTPTIRVNRQATADVYLTAGANGIYGLDTAAADLQFGVGNSERARLTMAGNLLVGVTSGVDHTIKKEVAPNANNVILRVVGPGTEPAFVVRSVSSGSLGSGAATCLSINRDAGTNRSVNAAGTVNAAGADYAEYMVKATGCGDIAKGDVCGVDREGKLTRSWAEAVRYVVKSTDPNLVGGDTWAAHMTPRPERTGDEPIAPELLIDGLEGDQLAGVLATYRAAQVTFTREHAAWVVAAAQHVSDLAAWEAELEVARQTVDRIAFSGQVPVNVTEEALAVCEGALEDGEAVYLVAVARGGGIGAQAVREGDMTLPLYMRRLGAVWAIRDGRPWLDVQHG